MWLRNEKRIAPFFKFHSYHLLIWISFALLIYVDNALKAVFLSLLIGANYLISRIECPNCKKKLYISKNGFTTVFVFKHCDECNYNLYNKVKNEI